jgi:hypothetical protein
LFFIIIVPFFIIKLSDISINPLDISSYLSNFNNLSSVKPLSKISGCPLAVILNLLVPTTNVLELICISLNIFVSFPKENVSVIVGIKFPSNFNPDNETSILTGFKNDTSLTINFLIFKLLSTSIEPNNASSLLSIFGKNCCGLEFHLL